MVRKLLRFILKLVLWFFALSIFSVIFFRFVPVPYTPLMFIRLYDQKKEGKSFTLKHDWVSLDKISPNLQKAVIVSEDGHFLSHNGFDFKAIEKAMKNNEKGKRIKGGSTISQQTAKNVFLWPGRSYIRKGFEAYFTALIELLWSKERILEVYLNSIEMGDGIYGAEAAAQHWYKKSAAKLTVNEAAGLAVILPSPRRYNPVKSGPYVSKRKQTISRYIKGYGPLDLKKKKQK
ncbi:monofunctional biosynthetic peptidoglycan transglycosylase [Myroides odoratus]|uniref:Biosynthetic peptidoglycan transglycosylase n=1 Tax=Myroides odoratus TaxID=256 RepID=A0A9Q6ZAZ8_MYROD|nr:monofunctional biosynthetic peptidoglycan transglycosylase [Myroides odoratus]EHQ42891.1 Monofunctional biosynthetic peptidoglycan transglycosylase [Myroides odoratus DSM 2801]EKB07469.1 monofunctional biosynthetic peptidoglycan transglycosylase [Myroides odoratus CIP 103059]QQU00240.1 monofunctional biosynthetic peptidoglycan transglycosylase [Myroides odoratus]WQD57535.1 monofunctional biosynthetic peptidoglycan transglycosylase [Myroides odoratus]STZ30156.1 Penicillin-binding protein 4 p